MLILQRLMQECMQSEIARSVCSSQRLLLCMESEIGRGVCNQIKDF